MVKSTEIQKIDIPLKQGQTLESFTRSINDALQTKYGKVSTPTMPGVWTWCRAIYSDNVVFEQNGGKPEVRKLLQTGYSVDDSGKVTFDDNPVEVREVLTFEPVKSEKKTVTMKSYNGREFWKGVV